MQSKTFHKSIKTAPTILFLSRLFFQFSIRLISTWFALQCLLYAETKFDKVLYYREHTVIYEPLTDFLKSV